MKSKRTISVALVEDDAPTRARFEAAIGADPALRVAGVAATVREALAWLEVNAADVLLVDLGLPDGSGLEVIRRAAALRPGCEIMVISMFGDEAHVLASIEAGASGYLLKDSLGGEIAGAIHELRAGGSPMSPVIARRVIQRFRAGAPPVEPTLAHPLSERETQVLNRVARGFTCAETGRGLGITENTVKAHIRAIYRKLEVNSRGEAVYRAGLAGLLNDGPSRMR